MRLIDADALVIALINECNNDSKKGLPVWIEKMIDTQPTIRVKQDQPLNPKVRSCGNCGAMLVYRGRDVCPNCGKKVNWDG